MFCQHSGNDYLSGNIEDCKMNVYDFDKTIFYPDCTLDFIRWCIRRRPAYAGKWLPKVSLFAILYTIGLLKREEAERQMLKFFKYVENPENEVREYWESHRFQMSPWYLLQKKSDDLIISASPEFIVKPMTDQLGVRLIATQFDIKEGRIVGTSCYGKNKTLALIESGIYPEEPIDNFYSDSISDTPLALCADHAFLIIKKARKPITWPASKFLVYFKKQKKSSK